jgi:hypothetical protein
MSICSLPTNVLGSSSELQHLIKRNRRPPNADPMRIRIRNTEKGLNFAEHNPEKLKPGTKIFFYLVNFED